MTISHNSKDIVPGALIVLATTKEIICLVLGEVETAQMNDTVQAQLTTSSSSILLAYCDASTSFIGLSAKSGVKNKFYLRSNKNRVFDFLIYSPDHDQENSE